MVVNASVKVRLTKEEQECLEQAKRIINEIYNSTCDYECEIEFEDGMYYVLNAIQSTINNII